MISDQIIFALRQKIAAGETVYAISKATGVAQSILGRFLSDERKQIRSETIDRLCDYLGLGLAALDSPGIVGPTAQAGKPTVSKPATKPPAAKKAAKPAKKAAGKTGRGKRG